MPKVSLVQMPFASVEHPSIGLSLLKSGLSAVGIESRVHYPNLDFAAAIGVRRYKLVDRCFTEDLVGEWIFSPAAFPDHRPDPTPYLDSLNLSFWPNARAELDEIRQLTEAFVDQVARQVLEDSPRLVGASSVFAQNCASLALLRRIKELSPTTVTVLGGANCEAEMGLTLVRSFSFLDYAVSGEADLLFPEFCEAVLAHGGTPPRRLPFGVMSATSHLGGDPPRASIDDLDRLPVPDFEDYFGALERSPIRDYIDPGLMIETSRGCWWGQKHHCTFCGLNGQGIGYRAKSSERVLQEFDQLAQRHRNDRFEVVDNIIAMPHLQSVLPEFAARGGPYRIFYETKSNLKRKQVELLAAAGVRWIQPGIESMHTEVLKLMDKGSTAAINVCLLKWAREFGVRLSWNFLCDFPGEDDAWYLEMAQWLPLISHLQPPGGLHRVRFDRFSPYYSNPEKYGLEIVAFDSYRAVYPLEQASLANIAYFFRGLGRSGSGERPGLRALRNVVDAWKEAFWNRSLPVICSMTVTDDAVEILDTRPVATARRRRLEGLDARLLCALETPQSEGGLQRLLELPTDEATQTLAAALERLEQARLVVRLDGRWLALPVEGSLPTLPGPRDFPGGVFYDTPRPALTPC